MISNLQALKSDKLMNPFSKLTHWYNFDDFLAFTGKLLSEGKTTGDDQSEEKVEFTRLNQHRMERWYKTFHTSEALQKLTQTSQPQIWWVLSEAWCGDNAAILPVLAKIAHTSEGHIELRIILRDENIQIMDQYLTNGARSIPLLISRAENDGRQLFVWGPRPAALQQYVMDWKAQPGEKTFEELKTEVQHWYNRDKAAHITGELSDRLNALQEVI